MLPGTRGLSPKSVHQSLRTMLKRAAAAGPFHVALFFLMVCRSPDLKESAYAWAAFGTVCVAALARFAHLRMASLLLKKSVPLWRAIFFTHTLALAFAWGGTAALGVLQLGVNTTTITVFALVMGICAASVPAFSFDLLTQFTFQTAMIVPVMICALRLDDPNALTLGLSFGLFLIFMYYAGASIFRFQVDLLRNSEIVEAQKLELQRAHGLMSAMLESINEVFLRFDRRGVCFDLTSQKSKMLLGQDPSGRTIAEIFGTSAEDRESIEEWYELLISERFAFETLLETAPQYLRTAAHTLKTACYPMRDSGGRLEAVIVTATDVTAELAAEAERADAQERASLVLRIHENRSGFRALLTRYETVLSTMTKWQDGDLTDLRRDLHTMKGGFRMFGAEAPAKAVYEAELFLLGSTSSVCELGQRLRAQHETWLLAHRDDFNRLAVHGEEPIELSARRLLDIQNLFASDETEARVAKRIVEAIGTPTLGDFLADFRPYVRETANNLGKRVTFEVVDSSDGATLTVETRDALRTLVHLFNNSLDHGIEDPAERRRAGKGEIGKITVRCERTTDAILLLIADDGRGIDVAKIRAKRGVHAAADLDVANLIFSDGFTTAETVTQISGQGIGAGSTLAALNAIGGHVRVIKTGGDGTTFEVRVPAARTRAAA